MARLDCPLCAWLSEEFALDVIRFAEAQLEAHMANVHGMERIA